MNKNFHTDIAKIKEAINAKKLVVLAGAGVSVDSGTPSWQELVQMMSERMEINPSLKLSEPEIAQRYYDLREHKEYIEDVRRFLKHGQVRPNQLHELIFDLKPEHIVTTNFDDLFEQTITKRSEAYSVVKKDTDLPYCQNRNLVIKIHGDLGEGNFILKQDDYDSFEHNHILQISHLQALFATRLVLIIGYTFRDENLKLILRNVTRVLGVHHQMAYMFVPDRVNEMTRSKYRRMGLKLLSYHDAESNGGESISEHLKKSPIASKTLNITSVKGRKVAEFLTLIQKYDVFNQELSRKELTDQLESALFRFSELRYIPPSILIKLSPFLSTKAKTECSYVDLKIANRKLSDVLINKVEVAPGRIKLKKSEYPKLNQKKLAIIESQLTNSIRVLYASGVRRIFGLGKRQDSLGNHGRSKDFQELWKFQERKECNCLVCKFQRNEIDSAIEKAQMYTLTRNPTSEYDNEVGYFYYLIGEFKRSKEIFLNVASSAWNDRRLITFYIALKNLKKLDKLQGTFELTPKKSEQIDGEEKVEDERSEQIHWSLIPDFDLDEALLQINPADSDELSVFKHIRDDKAISDSKRIIENALESAKQLYVAFTKNPRRMVDGPEYHRQATHAIWQLWAFYSKNRIVGDIYGEYRSVCELYVETQIVSFCTHSNYTDRLKSFDRMFFFVSTQYLNAKDLNSLFLRYDLKQLKFNASEQKWVLKSAENFFRSFYKEYKFFGAIGDSSIAPNMSKIYFSQELRRKFNCLLFILGKSLLNKEEFAALLKPIFKVVERTNFLQITSYSDYLPEFLLGQRNNITTDQLEEIQTLFVKNTMLVEDEMVIAFEILHKEMDHEPIDDIDLLDRLWPERIDGDFLARCVYVWRIASESKRKVLSERLEKFYSQQGKMTNTSLYQFAAREGVIDWNSSFEKYVDSVYKFVSVHKKTDVDKYKGTNPRHEFLLAMRLIYSESIDINDPRLAAFKNLKEEYQKFYLNPEGYDYRKFKTDWLLFLDVPEFFKRFKKIPQITKKIEAKLKKDFDPKLAEIYYKHFKQNTRAK